MRHQTKIQTESIKSLKNGKENYLRRKSILHRQDRANNDWEIIITIFTFYIFANESKMCTYRRERWRRMRRLAILLLLHPLLISFSDKQHNTKQNKNKKPVSSSFQS